MCNLFSRLFSDVRSIIAKMTAKVLRFYINCMGALRSTLYNRSPDDYDAFFDDMNITNIRYVCIRNTYEASFSKLMYVVWQSPFCVVEF